MDPLPAGIPRALCPSWDSPALKDQTQGGVLCYLQWLCLWKPGAAVGFCTGKCGASGVGLQDISDSILLWAVMCL